MGAKNLKKLGDFGFEGQDVPDPYFFPGFEGFEAVYTMIDKAISQLILSLSSQTNNYY
jgi:protein-tyrosine phosphatase